MTALPCPWCGHTQTSWDHCDGDGPEWAVRCSECEAEGPWGDTKKEALEAWNDGPNHNSAQRKMLRVSQLQQKATDLQTQIDTMRAEDNVGWRISRMNGKYGDVEGKPKELFATYREMAIANGVPKELLADCVPESKRR